MRYLNELTIDDLRRIEGPEALAKGAVRYQKYIDSGMKFNLTGDELKNRYETTAAFSKFYLNGKPIPPTVLATICRNYATQRLLVAVKREEGSPVKHYDIQQDVDLTPKNTPTTGTKQKPLGITKLENKMKEPLKLMEILKEASSDANGGGFDGAEFKQLVGEAATELWSAFNKIEITQRYLETHGQGGLLSAFWQKFKIDQLKKTIEALDEYADS